MKYYAHTKSNPDKTPRPEEEWEPLFTKCCGTLEGKPCEACQKLDPEHGHLNKVAYLCSQFAYQMFEENSDAAMSAAKWGHIAGLWHDLGKFAPVWQRYIKQKVDPDSDDIIGTVDHSTAGAQFSVKSHPLFGHLLAYGIAAHHSGLLDVQTNGRSCQEKRLLRDGIEKVKGVPDEIKTLQVPSFPGFLMKEMSQNRNTFSAPFFTRMIFSCLVDADFVATESFMNPDATSNRNVVPDDAIKRISELVRLKIDSFGIPSKDDIVNQHRARVVADCAEAAKEVPGLFSLTVPTGGGKTLSSLHFGLRHALKYGQKRIIYVVPFTSIIEQNADVIREIVSPLETESFIPLIEHHSSLSDDNDSEKSRLASENWDAPLVITTAVQFFESLFAAKTSRNRKLHNIANAVVILDEAQTLPVNYLSPCLRTIQELSEHYNTTVVLCSATQPAVGFNETEFSIGLKNCREIIQNTQQLFDALKRVEIEDIGLRNNVELAGLISQSEQVLCVVNRRKHAQELFQQLAEDSGRYHLSALMCPVHRRSVLDKVRERLDLEKPVRLVSTQLIEAGVDVDFPVVYRALAGLDSMIQAAGRCNRNGKQTSFGKTYIFRPDDEKAEAYFRETAQVGAQVMALHDDLLSQEAIRSYFDLYYYRQKERWDEKRILDNFHYDGRSDLRHCPFRFNFRTASDNFKLIDDWQIPVLIPYDEKACRLIVQLRNEKIPLHRKLLRSLQGYTVQISPKLFNENKASFEALRNEQFYTLISLELNYSDEFGLILDETHSNSRSLIY